MLRCAPFASLRPTKKYASLLDTRAPCLWNILWRHQENNPFAELIYYQPNCPIQKINPKHDEKASGKKRNQSRDFFIDNFLSQCSAVERKDTTKSSQQNGKTGKESGIFVCMIVCAASSAPKHLSTRQSSSGWKWPEHSRL